MKREIKQAISGIVLIASLISIILVQFEATSPNAPIAILLLVVIFFISMAGLITFSKTGWEVKGSEGEWDAAIIMKPSALLFWNRNYKEQVRNEGKDDKKKDEDYYKQRSK